MKSAVGTRWILAVPLIMLCLASMVEAGDGTNPFDFLQDTKDAAKTGWSYLMIAAAFVIGGGALAVGGRALFRGDWQHGMIGIGFGIVVLLVLWSLGGFFGLNS